MARVHNFNAGPAALPLAALERAQRELLDFEGTGMSIIEHSHRGKEYEAVHNEAIALLRELLARPGRLPRALPAGRREPAVRDGADEPAARRARAPTTSITGGWSEKAVEEAAARRHGARRRDDRPRTRRYTRIPHAGRAQARSRRRLRAHHDEQHALRDAVARVARRRERAARRRHVERLPVEAVRRLRSSALIYAGAQKNIGPSGVVGRHRAEGPRRRRPQGHPQDLPLRDARRRTTRSTTRRRRSRSTSCATCSRA